MDVIVLEAKGKEPLYLQLYSYFKSKIEQNQLVEGHKLSSIRELANSLSISKITVEKAYQQLLSEGYIESSNRSRYTVSKVEGIAFQRPDTVQELANSEKVASRNVPICYDFSSGEMDKTGFDFALWKRYINKGFLEYDRLTSYGSPKGAEELRREIARYIRSSRGVNAHWEQIIVGPGVQSLLNMLCSLLKADHRQIAFEEPGFKNGRRIFADHNFDIVPITMDKDGIAINELSSSEAQLLYLSPSHQFPTGHIMPIGKRNSLLNWAEKKNALIIEDDYDSEFRYIGRPIPALKGLDKGGNVVYLGSFSKIIPPSIRISFMVLPDWLLERYEQKSSLYNQAASTLEQLALARFMADGHLERQIRRLRKLYHEKSMVFYEAIRSILGDKVTINASESGLHTVLNVKTTLTARQLMERAIAKGCAVATLEDYYWEKAPADQPQMLVYFSKIPSSEIKEAVRLLKQAWF